VFDEKEASVLEELAEAVFQKRLEQAWIPAPCLRRDKLLGNDIFALLVQQRSI